MKELSIEEKAKVYDEAIGVCRKLYNKTKANGYTALSEAYEQIFPELKKSEEENIRKDIIKAFKVFKEKQAWVGHCLDDIDWDACISWLEKQGEQKSEIDQHSLPVSDDSSLPTFDESIYHPCTEKVYEQKSSEWSEDDETTRNNISHIIRQYDKISKRNNQPCWYIGDCLLWIQNLKDRVQPQPKQEWSRDDEQYFLVCKNALAEYQTTDKWDADIISHWLENKLKSLRPQNHWKPSDEQMTQLKKYCLDNRPLTSLYEQLKKLK